MGLRRRSLTRVIRALVTTAPIVAALFGVSALFLPVQTMAAAPQTVPYLVNFQGKLTDNNGNVLSDGSYNIKFRLYTVSSGGTNIWEEDHIFGASDKRVTISDGLFDVQLGTITSISPTLFDLATQGSLYLEVELPTPATAMCATNGCATWTEGAMTPRQPLSSSAYAFNSQTLDGLDETAFAQITANNTFTGANLFAPTTASTVALTVEASTATGSNSLSVEDDTGVQQAFFDPTGALTLNKAIKAPTTGNTINSLIINAGALSGVTGYAQASGNFLQSGTGTFGTGTGAVSLNGTTTIAAGSDLIMPSGVGTFQQTFSSTVADSAQVLNYTNNNTTAAGVTMQGIDLTPTVNAPTSGTNTLNIVDFAAGTALTAAENANGLNFESAVGYTNYLKTPTAVLSSAGAFTGLTGVTLASGNITTPGNISTTGTGTISSAGVITGPTTTDTINGLVINAGVLTGATSNTLNGVSISSGALSGITGYAQASGNFAQSGTGTFGTGTGAVSLNGATTVGANQALTADGSVLMKDATASTTALQVQNTNSVSDLTVDTTNNIVTTAHLNVGTPSNASNAGRIFTDGFESGNFDLWSSGKHTVSGTPTDQVETGTVRAGKYAAQFTNAAAAGYVSTVFGISSTTFSVRSYVFIPASGGLPASGDMDLMQLNAGTTASSLGVFVDSTGKLGIVNDGVFGATAGTVLTTGTWHEIELRGTTGTSQTVSIYLDGGATADVTTATNTNANTMSQLWVGEGGAANTDSFFIDGIVLDTGTTGTGPAASLNVLDSLHTFGNATFGAQVLDQTTSNSTVAFQIQNAAGNSLFSADTVNMNLTIAGASSTSFATLVLTNAHFESTQGTAPTIGTPTACGTGGGIAAAVTAGSTDSAGSFTITAGNGTQGICTTVITFQHSYGVAPKSIILTPTNAVGSATGSLMAKVSAESATGTTFTVSLLSASTAAGTVYGFNYWVIQ